MPGWEWPSIVPCSDRLLGDERFASDAPRFRPAVRGHATGGAVLGALVVVEQARRHAARLTTKPSRAKIPGVPLKTMQM